MVEWTYTGKAITGEVVNGEISAINKKDVENLLQKKRIRAAVIKRRPLKINFSISQGVPVSRLARFIRQFATMNSAGFPLVQSLETLEEQTDNKNLKKALEKVGEDIQSGSSLADAFSRHPRIFSELHCHMIAAGEAGGILDSILSRMADYMEQTERLTRKIKGAMVYPAFVLFISVAVVIILLWKVVPTFASMFENSGYQLPLPTRIVLSTSDFIQDYFIFLFLALISVPIFIIRLYKTGRGRMFMDKLLLSIPVLGGLIRKSCVARFADTLGTMLSSGIPIIDALKITSKTTGNKVLERGILQSLDSIKGGKTITEPLKDTRLFPPMLIDMIAVGEKTGTLSDMLDKVAGFYRSEVNTAVDSIISLIEPMIIVILGIIIGLILVAMYLPIFGMATNIS
jgi:type IV pilus assembly protein PilC